MNAWQQLCQHIKLFPSLIYEKIQFKDCFYFLWNQFKIACDTTFDIAACRYHDFFKLLF